LLGLLSSLLGLLSSVLSQGSLLSRLRPRRPWRLLATPGEGQGSLLSRSAVCDCLRRHVCGYPKSQGGLFVEFSLTTVRQCLDFRVKLFKLFDGRCCGDLGHEQRWPSRGVCIQR
jgi:hypothetical protein